jgi:hypothetical protein
MQAKSSYDYAASTERLLHHVRGIPQWRYRCPDADCRCPTIVVRELLGDVKRYNEVSKGTHPDNQPSIGAFRCKQCGLGFDEPYDEKNDQTRPLKAFV